MAIFKTAEDALACNSSVVEPKQVLPPISLFFDESLGLVAMPSDYRNDGRLQGMCRREAYRRMTRLILVLEAWKLDHGKLPDSLAPLDAFTTEYMPEWPNSPYNSYWPIEYSSGYNIYINWKSRTGSRRTLPPGTPYVSCVEWDYNGHYGSAIAERGAINDMLGKSPTDAANGATAKPPSEPETWNRDNIIIVPIP